MTPPSASQQAMRALFYLASGFATAERVVFGYGSGEGIETDFERTQAPRVTDAMTGRLLATPGDTVPLADDLLIVIFRPIITTRPVANYQRRGAMIPS